ncbi:MAG: tRNA (adenosine(37)-N6)-threonylcarbamoyltransferase complex dimerization subunit type 1 TsaB [Azoarcus sp.]|nr:tRNA (adenosine(37)-N6)-threonylcarbamoyltransferase complex dimerization subunit type 1 TsaB [Azoarcus sp.]
MNFLALETSCEHASVALYLDGEIREHLLDGHANHSEYILSVIRDLLLEASVRLPDLDAVAFGSGPGAFTGLRLACGIAQGLALGAGLGIVPVCSLSALAMQSDGERTFVATDARMNEVYHCTYRFDRGLAIPLSEPACTSPETLQVPEGPWFGIGSAFSAHESILLPRFGSRLTGCNAAAVPRASDIARLAAGRVGKGEMLSAEMAAPLYVRDKVALTTAERLARGGRS